MDRQRMPFRCIPQPGTKNHFFAQRVLGESMVIVVLGSMGGCFMMFLSPKNAFLHHAKSTLTVHQATFHDRSQTYDLHVYRHAIYMAVDPTKDAKQYGKGRFWRGWSGRTSQALGRQNSTTKLVVIVNRTKPQRYYICIYTCDMYVY